VNCSLRLFYSFERSCQFFIEEAGGDDFAGVAGVGPDGDVDDGVVGKFGDLAGIVEVVVFAEGKAAVEDDVAVWVFGIRVDEGRDVARRVVGPVALVI
jgi:hypothetical protein